VGWAGHVARTAVIRAAARETVGYRIGRRASAGFRRWNTGRLGQCRTSLLRFHAVSMMRRDDLSDAMRSAAQRGHRFNTTNSKGHIMSDTTNDAPVLELLARMTADSLAASDLDIETLILVRIAALVAVDAPPVSYALNLEAAGEAGLDAETVRGVFTAIAPIVGTARIAAATGNIVKALAAEIQLAELEVAELEDEGDDE